MFVQRVAGPSRLCSPFAVTHKYSAYRSIGKRHMGRTSSGRLSTALVDPRQGKGPAKGLAALEALKEQGEQAERMGRRGRERRALDEEDLPTMDVYMVPKRPQNSKELYFPYYPSNPFDWPFFAHANWDSLELIFSPQWWRALLRTIVTPRRWNIHGLKYILTRSLQLLRDIRMPRINRNRFNPLKLRSNFFALRRSVASYIVEASRNGPKAKERYLKKLASERANFKAMLLIASKQRFPEYIYGYPSIAERRLFKLDRYRQREQRLEEDRLFTDLSSHSSPLRPILRDAAEQYKEMNKAIARGDQGLLRLYAGKSYLREVQNRAQKVERESREVRRNWEFKRWINPPVCLSIRSNDPLAGFNRSLVNGERLFVNMLVKFKSMQSITVSDVPLRGKLRSTHPIQTRTVTTPVTEYLVLDVRTWVEGRKPKFIQEVYEGQELAITEATLTEDEIMKEKDAEKDEDNVAATAAAPTATPSLT